MNTNAIQPYDMIPNDAQVPIRIFYKLFSYKKGEFSFTNETNLI